MKKSKKLLMMNFGARSKCIKRFQRLLSHSFPTFCNQICDQKSHEEQTPLNPISICKSARLIRGKKKYFSQENACGQTTELKMQERVLTQTETTTYLFCYAIFCSIDGHQLCVFCILIAAGCCSTVYHDLQQNKRNTRS